MTPAPAADSLFPTPGHAERPADGEPVGDPDKEPRGRSYTWLHYLILVAVAFVLGLLIWQLVLRGDDPASSANAQAAQTLVPFLSGSGPQDLGPSR